MLYEHVAELAFLTERPSMSLLAPNPVVLSFRGGEGSGGGVVGNAV
jgi:hypothetical protein